MKKLIILLTLIYSSLAYSQEVYLLKTVESQKPFNIKRCNETILYNLKDQKYVIKLRYDQDKNQLFYSFYDQVYPPYEGKSLFQNESKEMIASDTDLNIKNLKIKEILNSPISAGKLFSTSLSHQQQWNDGISWSFIEPYELNNDNIPTLSFKKTK